jgi:chromosome partitioning protein
MNVITLASRKGGAGKSTLTAHLSVFAQHQGHRCLVVDADPQASLSLWHSRRVSDEPRLESAARGIERLVAHAIVQRYDWVFIDTSPTMWVVVQEAIRAATLVVIPARPGFFDIAAVRETAMAARKYNKPYAVVINAAPVKRDDKEAPAVALSRAELNRLAIPTWSGQISHRSGYMASLAAGASVSEIGPETVAATEMARLWSAIERSVEAINGAARAESLMHSQAA